jgi:uncharacterized phiE125 gp8 family phage protein
MGLKLLTAAAIDVVTLAEIKQHCRVDHTDDDALLPIYVRAAVSHFETHRGMMGLCFGQQTWELYYDTFPIDGLEIPLRPLISVDSVEYLDPTTGAYVAWPSASNYTVDTASYRGWVAPVTTWPTPKDAINAVKITFKAGFGNTNAAVPDSIRLAVMMLAGHWYENRETVGDTSMKEIPFAVDALIGQWREITV